MAGRRLLKHPVAWLWLVASCGHDLGVDAGSDAGAGAGDCPTPPVVAPDAGLTEEQWQALQQPLDCRHAVVSRSCAAEPIAQEYRVQPHIACFRSPRFSSSATLHCVIDEYCSRHEQCTVRPFGACRGAASASCRYPVAGGGPCSSDADCAPGRCFVVDDPGTIRCYPTGECVRSANRCYYPWETCERDQDCTLLPGGWCERVVQFTRCDYHACEQASDCGPGRGCVCSEPSMSNVCVPADCLADADCGAGQQCRVERDCHGAALAMHCSSPEDTCSSNLDCTTGLETCTFLDGSWRCLQRLCPATP